MPALQRPETWSHTDSLVIRLGYEPCRHTYSLYAHWRACEYGSEILWGMATVVPRLKKRRISPHASGDATSPSTSQRGMIDASYMPISSPMHDVPMYYSAPSSDIHASSYPAASASDVMLNQPLPSGPDAPSHPRPRMCIHEIINGQEQPVYVVSDDDDDDDGPPPASPLQGHAPLASTRPAINAGSKRKSPGLGSLLRLRL